MFLGSNHLLPAGCGQSVLGSYYTPAQGVPATFPLPPPGMVSMPRIHPAIDDTVAGRLDAELAAWFAKAPPGSLVTAWHEANGPSRGLAAGQVKAVHAHLAALAASTNPGIAYGAILDVYGISHAGQAVADWIPGGLAWVGFDGYQESATQTPGELFSESVGQLGPGQAWAVTETNSNQFSDEAAWLTSAAVYAASEGAAGFMPFIGGPPGAVQEPVVDAALAASLGVICALSQVRMGATR
jgi:hypothetical protein